jgi:apolipoprotein N-acyltransferase
MERTIAWSYIGISIALYVSAFLVPSLFNWAILVYLVPLFLVVVHNPDALSYRHGFWWGVGAYGITFSSLWHIIFEQAHCLWKILASALLLLYFSSCSALWFGVSNTISRYYTDHRWIVISWIAGTSCFWYLMRTCALFIVGINKGLLLLFPLVPLAQHTQWLWWLPIIGSTTLGIFLLIGSWGCAYLLYKPTIKHLLIMLFSYAPFFSGWFLPSTRLPLPPLVNQILALVPEKYTTIYQAAENITQLLIQGTLNEQKTQIIVAAESSFPFPLNDHPWALSMWHENALRQNVLFILGSYRRENERMYNTLYLIQNGRIIKYYDKTSLMPFFEKTPPMWRAIQPFKKNEFMFGSSMREPLQISSFICIPYICSEFFFQKDFTAGEIILCIVNDSWFLSYMKNLLKLTAQFNAHAYRCSIVYVSYAYALYIDQNGKEHEIKRIC